MVETQFADNKQGYDKYYSLIKNLEGIFETISKMKDYKLDISFYENELESIKKEFHLKDEMLQSSTITFENFRTDYEMFTLGELNKRLEKLTINFENNVTPIYNIYKLFGNIDKKINNKDNDDIDEVINNTLKLIDNINNISTHNNIEITTLIDRAHKTIFDALLYEEVYDRHEILNHLKTLNLSTNRESLGKIIRNETNKYLNNDSINEDDIDNEFIKHINEGLGYDFLSVEYLKLLSSKRFGKKIVDINEEKDEAIKTIESRINYYKNNKEKLLDSIKRLKINRNATIIKEAALRSTILTFILIPALSIYAGHSIGKNKSEKINEYATITREVDLNTNEVIGDVKKEYDEKVTTYVATVTVFEPWKKNPTGIGYIRNAISYEYITPEDAGEDFKITADNIEGNVKEKYRFSEVKDQLDANENTEDCVIHVVETYQDKSDSRKSTKFIIPFSILGGVLGTSATIALAFAAIYTGFGSTQLNSIKRNKEQYSDLLSDNKSELKELENSVDGILNDVNSIENKYNTKIDTTGLTRKLTNKKSNR